MFKFYMLPIAVALTVAPTYFKRANRNPLAPVPLAAAGSGVRCTARLLSRSRGRARRLPWRRGGTRRLPWRRGRPRRLPRR